jgi:hypothetical protein
MMTCNDRREALYAASRALHFSGRSASSKCPTRLLPIPTPPFHPLSNPVIYSGHSFFCMGSCDTDMVDQLCPPFHSTFFLSENRYCWVVMCSSCDRFHNRTRGRLTIFMCPVLSLLISGKNVFLIIAGQFEKSGKCCQLRIEFEFSLPSLTWKMRLTFRSESLEIE